MPESEKMVLKKLRKDIDKIDKQIMTLLEHRLEVVKKVADYKKKNNIPLYDKKREEEIILSKKEYVKEKDISEKYIEEIFKRIIKESHIVEKKIIDGKKEWRKWLETLLENYSR